MSLAALLGLCLLGAAAPEPPWGPFHQRSHAAISDNRLSYTGTPITPVVPGGMRAQLQLSQANLWAQMPGYFYDGEWTRLQGRFTYGVMPRLEVWVELALVVRSGGFLDGFIEDFHRLFRVTQSRRNLYPRDQLHVATIAADVQTDQLTNHDRGLGLANPVVGAKWQLAGDDGRAPMLAVEAALQLPWGSTGGQFATPRVGGLAALALAQPLGPMFHLDAAFGLVLVPGTYAVYGMVLSEVQKFLLVTLQMRLGSQAVLAIGYLNEDGRVERATFAPLNATSHEFMLGVRCVAFNATWEIGVIENTVHDANTADFGLFLGASRTF